MLPFLIEIKPGESASAQVVYAATRAIVAGEMTAGQTFPSVRELSQALRINPNTAHKIVAELVRAGLIEVRPGVGTVVAAVIVNHDAGQRETVDRLVDELVVAARRSGLRKVELLALVSAQWKALFGHTHPRKDSPNNDH